MLRVQEAIESTNTCRFYRTDPVSVDVLLRVLDAARYAPSGGNRQPVRFVVVRDPAKRRQLKEWYLPIWEAYAGQAKAAGTPTGARGRMLANADHFAQHLDEVPVLLVNGKPCRERCTLEPGATVSGDDFSLTLESVVGKRLGRS